MDQGNDKVKAIGIILLVVCVVGWSYSRSQRAKLGSTGNNGTATDFPAPPPEVMKTIQKMTQNTPKETPNDPDNPAEQAKMMKHFQDQVPNDQRKQFERLGRDIMQKMARTNAALTPEDQKIFRDKLRDRMSRARPPAAK